MAQLMALLLDAANILGGLLLAVPLLGRFPLVARLTARVAPWRWLVGLLALVAGGYYLIVHLFSGPRLFHFEVVGIAVGVLLAGERLTGRRPLAPAAPVPATASPTTSATAQATSSPTTSVTAQATDPDAGPPGPAAAPALAAAPSPADLAGAPLLVAVFGIIAMIVGVQGLFTPN